MIITHLLAYIVRDTSSKALQKMLENDLLPTQDRAMHASGHSCKRF